MSALAHDDSAPSVPTKRFRGSDALWAGHWATSAAAVGWRCRGSASCG